MMGKKKTRQERKQKISLDYGCKCCKIYMIKNNNVSLLLRNRELMSGGGEAGRRLLKSGNQGQEGRVEDFCYVP